MPTIGNYHLKGEVIEQKLKERGWSKARFMWKAGFKSSSGFKNFISPTHTVHRETAERFAKALECDLDEIATIIAEPYEYCSLVRLPKDHGEWLRLRRRGIGGSDAGAVLGVSKWKTPLQLYLEKTGEISDEVPDNEAMWFGREAEDLVAKRFEKETGKSVRPSKYMFRSKDYPFMQANVDRLVDGEKAGLECKTANIYAKSEYDSGYIPPQYLAQCMHYLAVTGLDRWYIAILIPGAAFYTFVIERDDKQIYALMKAEEDFWNHVVEKTPPEATAGDGETLNHMYGFYSDDAVQLDLDEEIERLDSIITLQKDLKAEKEAIENRIKEKMAVNTVARSDNGRWVTWKVQKRRQFDAMAFKNENPDLYEKYIKESETRVFKLRKAGKSD
jgi:putative phage-type endonuclease